MSRILRSLVCLLLICCMLVNLSPLNAQASAVGATAAITAAGTVLSPAGLVVGATFIALGLAAAANPEGFQNMVDAGVSALESAGTWVKDGMVELLRTEDADGNASYYVPGDLLSAVNSMECFNNVREAVYVGAVATGYPYTCMGVTYTFTAPVQVYQTYSGSSGNYYYVNLFYSSVSFSCYENNGSSIAQSSSSKYGNAFICQKKSSSFATAPVGVPQYEYYSARDYCSQNVLPADSSLFDSLTGIDVGELAPAATDFTDGTSARQWSEEYTDRGLKVYGGGSGNNNNDGKWFWKVIIPTTAVTLYAMSQADQWSGETPKEFDDYSSVEEFEIVSRPEVEFGQGLELAPVTSPDPGTGTNPGTGTDPDPGTNPGTNPDPGTDSGDGSGTGNGSWKPPSDPTHFKLVDLSKFFPFCIPFDLFDFFKLLNADPVAPSFTWEIQDLSGQTYGLTVDLSQWDSVAQLFRRLQLFLFVCGLAAASRKYIKW